MVKQEASRPAIAPLEKPQSCTHQRAKSLTEAMTTNSVYVRLPREGDFIRLLELFPGSPSEQLSGKLVVHDLLNAAQDYTATSYVCGNDDRSEHYILISGTKLGIYKNADEVLRRFRSTDDSVHVWIDVACIDQDDPLEKAREVNLMYKVYQNASKTMIWMGPSDDSSRTAITYARSLDAQEFLDEYMPYVTQFGYSYYHETKSFVLDMLGKHPHKETIINSCAKFLLRPWFTRVWTEQEAAMSPVPIVVCGEDEIPWAQIFALAWIFHPKVTMAWPNWFLPDHGYDKLEPNIFAAAGIQKFRVRQMLVDNNASSRFVLSLTDAMRVAWRQRCFDPRDKIFAMRNIASDLQADDWAPQPDYTTPWQEVYADFAIRMAERGNSEALGWSGVCQQGTNSGLPSWAIDWREYPWTQYINHIEWCAGGKSFTAKAERIPKKRRRVVEKLLREAGQVRHSVSHCLQVTVIMLDACVFLGGTAKKAKRVDDVQMLSQDVADIDARTQAFVSALPSSKYITSEGVLDALNKTLIANTTDEDALADSQYVAEGASAWRSWLSEGADRSKAPKYHDAIDNMDTLRLKQFAVSERGYFCLVPSIAKLHDVVAIVKGYDMPVVLRPVGGDYLLLGDCYIHGMMELMAGNLIEEFRVKIRDGKTVWNPAGDVRRNGKNMDAGEYVRIIETLGERRITLV
ncbi:hypothetical protein PV08_11531 [Exophiala spinifera]|uniref:Heterokaryon incompatibility domain-containing protein n=1 Tax=Exophiala spinifera TaxID=91928 RepID=A0A0D1ZC42_9EURO|nr:uncharacterized protein PV08_11531 [Exophiala spinifera]KIW10567.1 hypothetical protein PV08_11531 [Exophiala spinifera]